VAVDDGASDDDWDTIADRTVAVTPTDSLTGEDLAMGGNGTVYDLDGVANSEIVDPSGPVKTVSTIIPAPVGGLLSATEVSVTILFLAALFAISLGCVLFYSSRRRIRKA
jgi:hypothetical protein